MLDIYRDKLRKYRKIELILVFALVAIDFSFIIMVFINFFGGGLIVGADSDRSLQLYLDNKTFHSATDRVTIDDSDEFSINESEGFTVSMWIRFDNTSFIGEGSQRDYINFVSKGSENNYEWMWRQYNSSNIEGRNNRISFYVFNLNGGLGAGSYIQEDITEGEWTYFTGVVREDRVEIWKNGKKRDEDKLGDYDISVGNGIAPLIIGSSANTPFMGSIDDFRIYNKALSGREIKKLYKELINSKN